MSVDENNFLEILNDSGYDRIIVKPSIDSASGVGVRLFYKNDNKWISHNGTEVLNKFFIDKEYGKDVIIQECAEQSEYISQFNSTSINTLRLTLYRSVKDDNCYVTSSIIRIGSKGNVVDNAHAGGCYVGIQSDGILDNKVLDQWGNIRYEFNNIDFKKIYQIPNWPKIIDFAKGIGSCIPHHRLLALDLMIDKEGNPKVIEFNCQYYSMWLFQFTTIGALGDFTDEIIEYCKEQIDNVEFALYLK